MTPADLHDAWRAAQQAWPTIRVAEDDFAAYVRARLDAETDAPPASSSNVSARRELGDLYLACACARGDAAAIATFEKTLLPAVDVALKRFAGTVAADEVKQALRDKLFVGRADARPKILEYSGRGKLATWVRISATRLALNLTESSARERPFDKDAIEQIIGAGEDPELGYLKRRYAEEFRAAFGEAFTALEARERTLLRYAFGEALTVDAIGAIYGVHRATAARWISKAHGALVEQIRRAMVARLRVDQAEYASILRLIESQIEISFDRYLGPQRDP